MTQSNRTIIAAAIIAMSASSSAFADSIHPFIDVAKNVQATETGVAVSQSNVSKTNYNAKRQNSRARVDTVGCWQYSVCNTINTIGDAVKIQRMTVNTEISGQEKS